MVVGAVKQECVPPKIAELIVIYRFTPRNRVSVRIPYDYGISAVRFRLPYSRRCRTRSASRHAVDRHLVRQSRSQSGNVGRGDRSPRRRGRNRGQSLGVQSRRQDRPLSCVADATCAPGIGAFDGNSDRLRPRLQQRNPNARNLAAERPSQPPEGPVGAAADRVRPANSISDLYGSLWQYLHASCDAARHVVDFQSQRGLRQWSAGCCGTRCRPDRGRKFTGQALEFLLGSRYCETDRFSDTAWSLFGRLPPGWARVQAICDYVHDRMTFSYPDARSTRTAWDGHQERIGVCRDFAHLAITLCRCMKSRRATAPVISGDIGCRGSRPDGFQRLVRGSSGGRLVYLRRQAQLPERHSRGQGNLVARGGATQFARG